MFENIINFFKKMNKKEETKIENKDTAKERLHLVLMQDRANVSADFLDMMKQEIIDVIKKYIDVDESEIDVKLTNKQNSDGTVGAPALYANIPIKSIRNESRKITNPNKSTTSKVDTSKNTNSNEEKDTTSTNQSSKVETKNDEDKATENNKTKKDEDINIEVSNQKSQEKVPTDVENSNSDNKNKQENLKKQENKNIKNNIKNNNNGNNKKANKK